MSLKWIIYFALTYCVIIIAKNNPLSLLIFIGCFIGYKLLTRPRHKQYKLLEKQLALLRTSIDSFNAVILNSGSVKKAENLQDYSFLKSDVKSFFGPIRSSNIRFENKRVDSYKLHSYLETINDPDLFSE